MSKFREGLNKAASKLEKKYQTHNRIEISKSALLHNFDLLKEVSGGLAPMPVLKSNAYGHGIEAVAEALADRDFPYICVDGYYEYLEVRKVSDQPVLVMGAIPVENVPALELQGVTYMVQDKEMISALGQRDQPVKIHLDIDTGMSRYGIDYSQLADILEIISSYPNLELEGLATHFADADNPDAEFTKEQGRRFDELVDQVRDAGLTPIIIHAAYSPGAPKRASNYANAFRPGLAFYGYNPLQAGDDHSGSLAELRPALKLISTVTRIHDPHPGQTVSYGRTFKADRGVRVGVVPVGYFEGLPRDLSGEAAFARGDDQLPIVGRICMNHTMIDLSSTSVRVGDEVVVINSDPNASNSAEHYAELDSHFLYEDLVHIAAPVRRILVD